MSLIIETIPLDWYEGVIQIARKRVVTFAPSERENVAAQLLPKVGAAFQIKTIRYDDVGQEQTLKNLFENTAGNIVNIVENGHDYTLTDNTRFVCTAVKVTKIEHLVRANGYRNGVYVSFAPALAIHCDWTFRGMPA